MQELEQRVVGLPRRRSREAVISSSARDRAFDSSISAATAVLNEKRSMLWVTRWIVAWRSRSSSASAGAVGGASASRSRMRQTR